MAGLDEMKVRIGVDLSTLTKGAADAARIISGIGVAASSISPVFAKTASAADNLQVSLGKIKNVDLSGLTPFVSSAAKVLGDTANAANLTIEPLNKSAKASSDLDAALAKMASDGTARINQLATEALGLNDAFKGVSSPDLPPIRVGAIPPLVVPTGDAIKSIQALENEIADLTVKLKNSVDPGEFNQLNRQISELRTQLSNVKINGLESTLGKVGTTTAGTVAKLGAVKPSSDRAGAALLDLSRIAQDAPFGFIGIQNNINPLLESFGRLRAESGSTGGALKALATGALGAGGLGLAVSVATGLLTVLAQQGFFKTTEKADEAKKKIEEFNKEVQGIFDAAGKEAAQTAGLVAVLQSETATREKKLATIKELQRINPEIFAGLKLEQGAVTGLDQAYQAYLQNLRTVIAAKIIQQKLEDSISKSLEFQGATSTKSIQAAANTLKQLNDQRKAQPGAVKTVGDLKYEKQLSEENKRLAEQADLQKQLAELQSGIKVAPDKSDLRKKTKDTRDYKDILRELNEELELNNKLASIGFITSVEQDLAKISKVKSAIESILKLKKGPGVDSPIIANLIESIAPEELRQQLEKIKQGAIQLMSVKPEKLDVPVQPKIVIDKSYTGNDTDIKKFTDEMRQRVISQIKSFGSSLGVNNIGIKVSLDLLNDSELDRTLTRAQGRYQNYLDNVEGAVRNTAANIGVSIGETLGDAFSGENFNLFGNLFQIIGQGLKQLGEAQIVYATSLIVLKNAIKNPYLALAAGIAAVAAGQVLQNSLPKFADGVQGFRGGAAVVGERGPEIVQLPAGANVIPNHRLDTITGSGVQVFIPSFDINGDKLRVIMKRADAAASRRG